MESQSHESSKAKASAGAYAQMFEISQEDTTFNEWEQAFSALLRYEFRCARQAEWQLFCDGNDVLDGGT